MKPFFRFLFITVLVSLVAACASPARRENPPLPDSETFAFPAGATPRQRIVSLAIAEWERWGRQTVQLRRDGSSCVAVSPLPLPSSELADEAEHDEPPEAVTESCPGFSDGEGVEATPAGCLLAQRYWRIVGEEPDCVQITTGKWAWSAVFISWVMRKAQLDQDQFLTGDSHSHYVVDARDHLLPSPAFAVQSLPAAPEIGDLVCAVRGKGVLFVAGPEDIRFETTPMHCDIVAAADPVRHALSAIGGNVQQSVSMTAVETDEKGMLHYDTSSRRPWVLILRNLLP